MADRVLTKTQADSSYLPKANRVIVFGNSISNHGEGEASATTLGYYERQGLHWWAQLFLGQRLSIVVNSGISGNTTTQMLARFTTDVLAYAQSGDLLVMTTAENDIGNIGLATIKSNLVSMWSSAVSAGLRIVAFTLFPSPAYSTTPNSFSPVSGVADAHAFNRWIKNYAATHAGFVLVDAWSTMVDPAATPNSNPLTGLTNGDVHPTYYGAARSGRKLADAIEPLIVGLPPVAESNSDPANLITNPMMTGTGGTVHTANTGITGGMAASWGVNANGAAFKADLAKVPRRDGINGEWQQVTVWSTAGGNSVAVYQQNVGPIGPKLAVGDSVRCLVEFETDSDCRDLSGLAVALQTQAGVQFGRSIVYPSGDGLLTGQDVFPRRGVLGTPYVLIPAGTTRVDLFIYIDPAAGMATAPGTVRLGRTSLMKAGV